MDNVNEKGLLGRKLIREQPETEGSDGYVEVFLTHDTNNNIGLITYIDEKDEEEQLFQIYSGEFLYSYLWISGDHGEPMFLKEKKSSGTWSMFWINSNYYQDNREMATAYLESLDDEYFAFNNGEIHFQIKDKASLMALEKSIIRSRRDFSEELQLSKGGDLLEHDFVEAYFKGEKFIMISEDKQYKDTYDLNYSPINTPKLPKEHQIFQDLTQSDSIE